MTGSLSLASSADTWEIHHSSVHKRYRTRGTVSTLTYVPHCTLRGLPIAPAPALTAIVKDNVHTVLPRPAECGLRPQREPVPDRRPGGE